MAFDESPHATANLAAVLIEAPFEFGDLPFGEVGVFSLVNIRPFVNTSWVLNATLIWVADAPLSCAPSPGKTNQMRATNWQRKAILYVTDM